ncbi:MAG: CDP-diacylglycerol--glycerol-3-phosphate 3-phosphatidyltransferase [Clostridia bacterium]|nr:CDP-diacylglycerol--glycerol-3-phosphate 3-phosphatidyltransferase [Clostridia bacterium]
MNLANKITVVRMLFIPAFLVLMLHVPAPTGPLWAFVIYLVASLTDKLDGYIARKYNLITTFGKFLDPLADKLLVTSALVCLTWYGRCSPYVTVLILARELVVTSFRIVAMGSGLELAADGWGKAKTLLQNIAIYVALVAMGLPNLLPFLTQAGSLLLWAAAVLTVYSGYRYLANNWSCIGTSW